MSQPNQMSDVTITEKEEDEAAACIAFDAEASHLGQVAEAALLILGDRLRWTRQKHPYVKEVNSCHIGWLPGSEEKLYIIEEPCDSNFNHFAVVHHARIHTYEAINDAKAACERHYASRLPCIREGKWEG